jgi:hypothetical protein
MQRSQTPPSARKRTPARSWKDSGSRSSFLFPRPFALRRTLRGVNAGLSLTPALVPRETAKRDVGNLAGGVEAEQQARRVAARDDELDRGESLIAFFFGLHDFGAQRRPRETLPHTPFSRSLTADSDPPLRVGIDPGPAPENDRFLRISLKNALSLRRPECWVRLSAG